VKFLGGKPPEELPDAEASKGEDPDDVAAAPAAPPGGDRFLPDVPQSRDRYAQMGAEGLFFQRLQNFHRYFEKWTYKAEYDWEALSWVYAEARSLLNEAAGLDEDDTWFASILAKKRSMRRLAWANLVFRELMRKFRSKQMFGRQALPHDRFELDDQKTVVFNP